MRTNLANHRVYTPASIREALEQRAATPGLIPIAGGTEVMVWMNDGKLPGRDYQSLHRLAGEWCYVRETPDGGLRIGALASYTDVRHHPAVVRSYPLLVESARVTGALQIQNRGTLVGNIANGSPAADTVPSLLVYDAKLRLVSLRGERTVELSDFFTGYRRNLLQSDELIAEIIVPPCVYTARRQYYIKVGTREAQAISKVVFSGARGDKVRMAWGSVAPTTIRSSKTEEAVARGASPEDAWKILQDEIAPIDDIRSTAAYRRKVVRNILFDFLKRTA